MDHLENISVFSVHIKLHSLNLENKVCMNLNGFIITTKVLGKSINIYFLQFQI